MTQYWIVKESGGYTVRYGLNGHVYAWYDTKRQAKAAINRLYWQNKEPELSWSQKMVIADIESDNAFKRACAEARKNK